MAARGCRPEGDRLIQRAVEKICDSREYVREPEKGDAVRQHLNRHLEPDGFEVVVHDGKAVLRHRATAGPLLPAR